MAFQIDWAGEHRQEVARREERRAKRGGGNGNERHATAQKLEVVGSEAFRAEILAELRRLATAERSERISGAHALRMRLRGQAGLKDLRLAAERLTAFQPPRWLFDDDVVEMFAEVPEEVEV